MAVTNGWGQATQNNTNGFGKYQNTIDAGSVYADSYAGETSLVGTSASFSYSASSYHQDESDPTPTITGTAGGTFSATPSGLSINTSTGTIDLDNSTIQSYTITYTVSGVSSSQSLAVTASPFLANTYSMQFDGTNYVNAGNSLNFVTSNHTLSMWIKTTSNSNLVVCEKGSNDELAIQTIFSEIRWAGTNSFDTSGANINNGNWHHLAVVADGSSSFIYVDGVLNATGGNKIQASSNTSDFNIGSRAGIIGVVGNIDEVAIWNAALSSDAVQEIYNATANNTGKALDLTQDSGNYNASSNLQYFNRLGD